MATAACNVSVSGSGQFSYLWRKDGVEIAGATIASYSTGAVTTNDTGAYCVVVSGACNSVTNCAILTVNDCLSNTPPTITSCAPDQSAFANGLCQAPVPDFTTNVVANDCNGSAPLRIMQTPAAGTLVGLGVTTVTLHVTDGATNESTCTASFTVTDNTPPTLTRCAPDQSAFANGLCQALVPDFTTNVVASDCNGSAPLRITQTPAAGTLVGLGVTTVTLHVTDAATNESTCTASFTVPDRATPTITRCAPDQRD